MFLMVILDFRFHCAATFDVKTKTGGPFGTMRLKEEQSHGPNVGLAAAVEMLEPIKQQFPLVSYGDLYMVLMIIIVNIMNYIVENNSTIIYFYFFLCRWLVLLLLKALEDRKLFFILGGWFVTLNVFRTESG